MDHCALWGALLYIIVIDIEWKDSIHSKSGGCGELVGDEQERVKEEQQRNYDYNGKCFYSPV